MSFGVLGKLGARGGFGSGGSLAGAGNQLVFAPAIDQPIITSGAGAASFPTATLHSFKRIGDNTTAVDIAGDPKFRYPAMPTGSLVPDTVNTLVLASMLPGGVEQARRWDTQIEMQTTSKFIALSWTPSVSNPTVMVVVNGKLISPAFTVTASAGVSGFFQQEFPDNRSRRVKLIISGSNRIFGVRTEAAYPPVGPVGNDRVLGVIGDSLSYAASPQPEYAGYLDTWPQLTALIQGFDHCCNAAIGNTKWVAAGAGDVAVSHFGGGRLAPLLTTSPVALVWAGSRNDTDTAENITAAVSAALTAAALPKMFVMGTFTPLSQNAAVKAGALASGVPFIDMTDGLQAGDFGSDNIHPSPAGALNLRNRIVPRLRAAGCAP